MQEREEKEVQIAGHAIRIRELTTEMESRIRADSQVYDRKSRMLKPDQAALDANLIYYSLVPSTWPEEWGKLGVDNIKALPSKLTRKLLYECQRLNTLEEDAQAFLDSRRSTQGSSASKAAPEEKTESSPQ
jgi:hypothetical protein